jgi:hypothetical protein
VAVVEINFLLVGGVRGSAIERPRGRRTGDSSASRASKPLTYHHNTNTNTHKSRGSSVRLGSEAVSVNPRNKQLTQEVKTVISAALTGPKPSNGAKRRLKNIKKERRKEIRVRRTQRERHTTIECTNINGSKISK